MPQPRCPCWMWSHPPAFQGGFATPGGTERSQRTRVFLTQRPCLQTSLRAGGQNFPLNIKMSSVSPLELLGPVLAPKDLPRCGCSRTQQQKEQSSWHATPDGD